MGLADAIRSNLRGALQMGAHLATGPLYSDERRTWGAMPSEVEAVLPGDDLVPDATWQTTRAVTCWAPPEQVWGYLAHIGLGRAGTYSYELLQELVGAHATPMPDAPPLRAGDEVRLHPQLPPLEVVEAVPAERLVLAGVTDPHDAAQQIPVARMLHLDEALPLARTVWSYHLRDLGDGRTRLVERTRYQPAGESIGARLAGGPYVVEAVSFVMSREMLMTLKALSEGHAR